MITLREAISQVRKSLREVTADSRLTNKYVYSRLISTVALIIQRESDSMKLSGLTDLFQPYKCMELIEVDAADRNCFGIQSKVKLYRSQHPIPECYQDSNGPIILRITSLDNFKAVKRVSKDTLRRLKGDTNSKYDKTLYAFLSEGYLYLTQYLPVQVDAYFKKEIKQPCLDCVTETPSCVPFLDHPFRVPQKTEDAILSKVIQDIANSYKRIPEDTLINKNPNA